MHKPNNIPITHSFESLNYVTAVIPLGKQYGIGWDHSDILASPDHLSTDSRITVQGAGYVCLAAMRKQQQLRVLFSGSREALFPGAAIDYMAENFPQVPKSWYENPDNESPTTEDSVENVPNILKREGHRSAALMTVSYHARRTAAKFGRDNSGLFEAVLATNSIVAGQSPADAIQMIAWGVSHRVTAERIRERGALLVERGVIGERLRARARSRRAIENGRLTDKNG